MLIAVFCAIVTYFSYKVTQEYIEKSKKPLEIAVSGGITGFSLALTILQILQIKIY